MTAKTKRYPTGCEMKVRASRGVSLIELLVSMAIGLVISLAAASAYLGTRGIATTQDEMSRLNEYGKLALDMIGRELQMAGYYPTYDSTISTVKGSFETGVKSGAAYNQGVFGCSGALFNPVAGTCDTADASKPDSVVVNYFSSLELGANYSNGFDCLNQDSRNDPANTGRTNVLISNRFSLVPTTFKNASGFEVKTMSFACNGNGQSTETKIYQPIFQGMEDMVIRYGLHGAGNSQSPERFYTATEVSALAAVNGVTGWQRVSAVRVCLLARTLENTRLKDEGKARSYRNCRGQDVVYASTDGSIYKTFERTFAVRNHINGIY